MFTILGNLRSQQNWPATSSRTVAAKLWAIVICLLLPGAVHALAQAPNTDTEFINLADTTSQGFTSFASFPAINNEGAVVFRATRNVFEGGIFKLEKGELSTVASTKDRTFRGFGISPAINKAGTVCLLGFLSTGGLAYFIADDSSLTKILDTREQGFSNFNAGDPAINSAGTCAFFVDTKILPGFKLQESVLAANPSGLETIVDTQTSGFNQFGNVGINASGEVVFVDFRQDGSEGIFVADSKANDDDPTRSVTPQSPIDILDTNTNPDFAGASFGDPVINRAGTVADVAFLANGGVEIFTADKRGVTARTDPTSSLFIDSEHPSINDGGVVAFSVTLSSGGNAILVESTGGASPVVVLKTGDSLFGSTVTSLFVGRFALNNHNQVVFQYRLKDGRSGIAIAAVHGDEED